MANATLSRHVREPRTRKLSRPSQPESCGDWLRDLFSGTYDLREAEAMRRLGNGHRAEPRPQAEKDER